jgi:DNA-binding MarR family transcriptional regulator
VGTLLAVSPSDAPDVWTRFAMSVFAINGLLIEAGEQITRPIGQTSARWQVLGRAHEPQTVAEMARDIGHARQSVQRMADVLADEGLLVYTDHPSDRRTKLVELTPRGRDVLQAIYARQLEWSRHIVAQLDPGQLAEVAAALEGIGRTLKQQAMTTEETDS